MKNRNIVYNTNARSILRLQGMGTRMEIDEEWLAEKIKVCQLGAEAERKEAWEEVARALLPRLTAMARREQRLSWLADRDLSVADDVVAEAFITLFTKIDTITMADHVLGWMRGVIRYKMRTLGRRGFYAFEDTHAEPLRLKPVYESRHPYHTIEGTLRRCVRALPPQSRRLIHLRYWEDWQILDMARRDKVFPARIQTRRQKALKLLRLALEKEGYTLTDIGD